MTKFRIKRIADRGMEPLLPYKSLALFRNVKSVKRSDIVLVDHPEAGQIVKKVAAVSVNGRIALRGMARASTNSQYSRSVERDEVLGKLSFSMKWVRFLPRFAEDELIAPDAVNDAGSDNDEMEEVGANESAEPASDDMGVAQ